MPETVGQQLKTARTQRSLTIEQAARVLHIRQKYLEALEEDHRKELPSQVQGKGFLRMYADYLSLPQQPLLDAWDGRDPIPTVDHSQPVEPGRGDALHRPGPPELHRPAPPELHRPAFPEPAPATQSTTPERVASVSESNTASSGKTENGPVQPIPLPTGSNITPPGASAKTVFIEIGKQLSRQRLSLGLSFPEVERYTHVRAHYLEALEEGHIDHLPSPVQGRGMLSNYARFLNLNVDALLLQFAEGLQIHRSERLTPDAKPKAKPARKVATKKAGARRLLSSDLLISSLLVVIILGFALWTAAQVDALRQNDESSPPPPSIYDVLLNKATQTPSATGTSTPQAFLSTLAPGEVLSGQPGQAFQPAITLTLPVSGNSPLQVYVIARIRAFMRITVDGKVIFEGRVVPGNAYPYSGEKKIELITGSAAAVQVFFNQKDLGVLGQAGQVKSLVFTKDGAVTPTSAFTATPTRTVQPTSTAKPSPTLPTSTITPLVP